MSEILIGVSACLVGGWHRYDGGDKRHAFLLEELASHVRFVPVCPEVAIGLGVPRETIRSVRRGDGVGLLGSAGVDHTDASRPGRGVFARALVDAMPGLGIEDEGRLHGPGVREHLVDMVRSPGTKRASDA